MCLDNIQNGLYNEKKKYDHETEACKKNIMKKSFGYEGSKECSRHSIYYTSNI